MNTPINSTTTRKVLIVGGGVAGPALALFLRKAGIASAVYEAHPFVEGVGGGLGLAPNGLKVLAALGLAAPLTRQAATISTFAFRNDRGATLATTRIDPAIYGQPMLALSRALLFETLAKAMDHERIEVHYDKRLARLEEHSKGVVAHFADGTTAEGDVLIGADGIRSVVRRHLLSDVGAEYVGMIGIGGFTPLAHLPALPGDTMTFVFGRRGFFGYSAADGDYALWWSNRFRDRELTRDELDHVDRDALKDELLDRFGSYYAPIPSLVERTANLLQLNVYDVPSLPTWHRGRIVLIGDAAHAVSPNAGQGASLALEDAMYLAKLLRDVPDYSSAFARFEQDRKTRAERVVAEGRRRGGDKSIVSPWRQKLREFMIRVFVPLFGSKNDRWLYEYDVAF
jgi:2-polyprenyl-6-methoxyphenol hydroxylase-like FAD-dependent oxidoreductase